MNVPNRFAAAAVLWLSVGLFPRSAEACSCLEASLIRSWHEASDTVAVEVQRARVIGQQRVYTVRVLRPFSGSLNAGDIVHVATSRSDAGCGQELLEHRRYLLTADERVRFTGRSHFEINACGYNRPLGELSRADWNFLRSRMWFDDGTGTTVCADGSEPVSCFVDPCEVNECDEQSVCEANYCGGCNAEHYSDNWAPVCETATE